MTMIDQDDTFLQGEISFVDIDLFYNFEAIVDGKVIAHLSHDTEDSYRSWVVTVNNCETFRANTYDQSKIWIETSYRYGLLTEPVPVAS